MGVVKSAGQRPISGIMDHNASPLGQDVAAMYEGGMTMPQIAAATGLNNGAVSRIVRRHGVQTRNANHDRIVPVNMEAVRFLYERGVPTTYIGRTLGVSRMVVQTRLKWLGLPPRRDGRPTDAQRAQARQAVAEATRRGLLVPSWGGDAA